MGAHEGRAATATRGICEYAQAAEVLGGGQSTQAGDQEEHESLTPQCCICHGLAFMAKKVAWVACGPLKQGLRGET